MSLWAAATRLALIQSSSIAWWRAATFCWCLHSAGLRVKPCTSTCEATLKQLSLCLWQPAVMLSVWILQQSGRSGLCLARLWEPIFSKAAQLAQLDSLQLDEVWTVWPATDVCPAVPLSPSLFHSPLEEPTEEMNYEVRKTKLRAVDSQTNHDKSIVHNISFRLSPPETREKPTRWIRGMAPCPWSMRLVVLRTQSVACGVNRRSSTRGPRFWPLFLLVPFRGLSGTLGFCWLVK